MIFIERHAQGWAGRILVYAFDSRKDTKKASYRTAEIILLFPGKITTLRYFSFAAYTGCHAVGGFI